MKIRIVFLRHAIAVDRDEFARTGKEDFHRPLTDRGKKKLLPVLEKLKKKKLGKIKIVSSPFFRAKQTAEMVGEILGKKVHTPALLGHGAPLEKMVKMIDKSRTNLLLVSHEPDLSQLLFALSQKHHAPFKKGETRCFVRKKDRLKFKWKIRP